MASVDGLLVRTHFSVIICHRVITRTAWLYRIACALTVEPLTHASPSSVARVNCILKWCFYASFFRKGTSYELVVNRTIGSW